MDGTLGEIRMWAGVRPPSRWMFCHGQRLPIQHYQALSTILPQEFGTDERTYILLPDFRGRFPIGSSIQSDDYLTRQREIVPFPIAGKGGSEKEKLHVNQLPSHKHNLTVSGTIEQSAANAIKVSLPYSTNPGDSDTLGNGKYPAKGIDFTEIHTLSGASASLSKSYGNKNNSLDLDVSGGAGPIDVSKLKIDATDVGKGEEHNNMPPYLGINFIICVNGDYPDYE